MPIYEFRCLECNEIAEFLFTSSKKRVEVKCPHCGGCELERVLSAANVSVPSSNATKTASASNRTCAGGSCSTLEIPGAHD